MKTVLALAAAALLFAALYPDKQDRTIAPRAINLDAPVSLTDGALNTQMKFQSSEVQTLRFKGYSCTVDCSGHEAGYEWAEQNDINDPDDCDGNSESFIEGCRAYAEEQESSKPKEEDEDEEDEE